MRKIFKIFLFFSIFFLSFLAGKRFFTPKIENIFLAQISSPLENIYIPPLKRKPPLNLNAKSAISLKTDLANFEKKIFSKEEKKILPIASLTKLMTALVVFEEGYDSQELIFISQKAASQEDSPVFGSLKEGNFLRVKDLLELMLVYSSNDAAYALSEKIGTEKFIEKMNEKAKILGLENTHFLDPTGLEPLKTEFNSDNLEKFNYSTAEDLTKLAKYILKFYPQIFEISKTPPKYKIGNGIFDVFLEKKVIGGKTGYTPLAGGCLLFVFKDETKPNLFYINIVLGTSTIKDRISEMQKIIDWLFI